MGILPGCVGVVGGGFNTSLGLFHQAGPSERGWDGRLVGAGGPGEKMCMTAIRHR